MLWLARHGRTGHNATRRLVGRADPPLDEVGEAQALALASTFVPDVVVTSPLLRARRTAAAFGVDVEVDERWIEIDYGDYDELPLADVPPDVWVRWRDDVEFAPPGGESLSELAARVHRACDDLVARARETDVLVVTHVSPLKAAVAWALGVGVGVTWRLFVEPASLSAIDVSGPAPVLRSFNSVAHLA